MKEIKLTQGLVALVDDEDYEMVNQHQWWVNKSGNGKTFYAAARIAGHDGKRVFIRLHQFLMGIKGIDHKDGNGLNNQRANLRPATQQEQNRNQRKRQMVTTSRYKGVIKMSGRKKCWRVTLTFHGRNKHIGTFYDEEEAARAYNSAAQEAYGEFANLNQV